MSLLTTCEGLYGLRGYTLRPLIGGVSDHTYALEREGAETFVLRVERHGGNAIPIREEVLLFLEAKGYPAPRVIRTLDGSLCVEYEGSRLVLTTFVHGTILETGANTPEALYEMGRMLGRLHALHLPATGLPVAEFMPQTEVPWAQGRLATIEYRVPGEWQYRLDEMQRSLAAIPSLSGLPVCLIHNDSHPGNAVYQGAGKVVLIDWDGAGLGPSILDLGFLLIAADTYTPDVPSVGSSDERVNAIIDGYSTYRFPERAELAYLADAMRYRVTVINAAFFARLVERDEFDKLGPSWWDGCAAAGELANRVRRRFDEHRTALPL